MIELKTASEVAACEAAGKIVADVLAAVRAHVAPGVTTGELDRLAADLIADAGAVPSFLGYHPSWAPTPYPGVICASVNDAVVHGIPGRTRLRAGDVLSVDLAVHLDGWCADAAFSTVVGGGDPRDAAMIDTAERALAAATRPRCRARAWATSRTPSAPSRARAATGCWPTTAGTAWDGRCTSPRAWPTRAGPAAGCRCGPGW